MLRDVVLPYLHELGVRWERGEASVAQEHFASNILRGRLLGLARGWAEATGPRAVLACAPGELHDLPLISFGLALAARGWSITYLGPDTPIATIKETLEGGERPLVVISAVTPDRFLAVRDELTELARDVRVGACRGGSDHEARGGGRCSAAARRRPGDRRGAGRRRGTLKPAPSRSRVELDAGPPRRRCGRVGPAR